MEEKIKEEITQREGFWLWVMRKNRETTIKEIDKHWQVGRLKINWRWRSKDNAWGRFGGGWNWKLGAQWGGRTIIINLLTSSLTLRFVKKEDV